MPKRKIPAFATETEEANWWYQNRRRLDRAFAEAARKGELKRLDKPTLATRSAASRHWDKNLPLTYNYVCLCEMIKHTLDRLSCRRGVNKVIWCAAP